MWGVEQVSGQLSPTARGMVETSWGACVHQPLAAHFLQAPQDGLHTSERTSCPGRAPWGPPLGSRGAWVVWGGLGPAPGHRIFSGWEDSRVCNPHKTWPGRLSCLLERFAIAILKFSKKV